MQDSTLAMLLQNFQSPRDLLECKTVFFSCFCFFLITVLQKLTSDVFFCFLFFSSIIWFSKKQVTCMIYIPVYLDLFICYFIILYYFTSYVFSLFFGNICFFFLYLMKSMVVGD